MLKRAFLLLFITIYASVAWAQTADEMYEKYLDFNLARFEGRTNDALTLGEDILPDAEKLNAKPRISFYYSLGNLFENNSQSVKALPLYEKVVAAVPDYYVGQRALAYMYGKQVDELSKKLNASQPNSAGYTQLYNQYVAQLKKTLPHLEKAQACDPTPETLALIKSYYGLIKDTNGIKTLNARLSEMSKTCIDLLDDK